MTKNNNREWEIFVFIVATFKEFYSNEDKKIENELKENEFLFSNSILSDQNIFENKIKPKNCFIFVILMYNVWLDSKM